MDLRRQLTFVKLTLALLLLAGAAQAERVVVVPYQSLNVDAATVTRLDDAVRAQLTRKGYELPETNTAHRAAAMCGEDLECLATIGTRAKARWVVAWGLARIGGSMLVNALLVETESGKRRGAFSDSLAVLPEDLSSLAARIVDALMGDLPVAPPAVVLVPKEVPAPVVVQHSSALRPWAIGTASVAGAGAIATVILGVLAQSSFAKLPTVQLDQRPAAVRQQQLLNGSADTALTVGVVAAVASLTLFLVDARAGGTP